MNSDKIGLLAVILLLMPMNIKSIKGIASMIRSRKAVK
jgi:hypothetical protein